MKRTLVIFIGCIMALFASAQILIIDNGSACGRIIITDTVHRQAAEMLQDFVERMSRVKTPIIVNEKVNPQEGDVVIQCATDEAVKEDGFRLSTVNGYLLIEGGKDKGSLYGVITILERYLGCNYWSENEYSVPSLSTITLPYMNFVENPVFRYRQSQNYAMSDPIYRAWMRFESPSEEFADGLWVHTFNRLLPSSIYGKSHPEYYAYFDGRRHPGKASQWCLTNDDVFEIVSARVDSIFKANPNRTMISVSQNDGNYTNCTCPSCKAIDEKEGALSGSVIHFLNRLADRFPDKQFSTLAYLYTMHPPKYVKPRPNVNIMLCNIDCYREVPLGDNASGRDFLKALEGWSKISDNIFVWDYGINFDGTTTPFPNFHIMQPNIRTFRDNNVKMHFSQIAGFRGGDMSELRTYMVSKLMWNPDADVDSLMNTFMKGYYGDAAPYIYQYLKIMEGALLGSRIPLWIYDSPVTHKTGMLNPILLRTYNQLFDQAEEAVQSDSVLLARVQRSRLSLQYSELEIARTEDKKDVADLKSKLDLFEARSRKFGLRTVNERRNSPIDYCNLYRERYLPKVNANLAAGATVVFGHSLSAPYDKIGDKALTDGLFGGATYKDSWVGWEGIDTYIILDLGEIKTISSVDSDFLHQLGAWILQPKSVTYSISVDGKKYSKIGYYSLPEDSDPKVKFVNVKHELPSPIEARYIRVDIEGTKQCPHWHYGVGNPCWFFIDEITVQ